MKKCVLVTRKIGLVKRRCKHTCKCPVCSCSFPIQEELNRHYHKYHDKVCCGKCNMMYTSPLTLTRHLYTHAEPRYHCHCGKSYHFAAELCVHKLTHRRIWTAIFSYPKCSKSYFSQADLAKHAKTHEKIKWCCNICNYFSFDRCLLKSHKHVHERKDRYFCNNCGKSFLYHTQWKWHKSNAKCVTLKRSDSPEH